MLFIPTVTRWDLSVCPDFGVKEVFSGYCRKYVFVEWDKARLRRLQGIWRSDLVVRFLPLSFYAKKKAAERKARISGGGAEDARVREHMAAPIPPLMYLPLTAQPIAKQQGYTRNGRLSKNCCAIL